MRQGKPRKAPRTRIGKGMLFFFACATAWLLIKATVLPESIHSDVLYNTASAEGRVFHQLSTRISEANNFSYQIIPFEALEDGPLAHALTPEGQNYVSRVIPLPPSMDPKKGGGAYSLNTSPNSSLCTIYVKDIDYTGLVQGSTPLMKRFVFLHEMAHCIHKQYEPDLSSLSNNRRLEDDLSTVINLDGIDIDTVANMPKGGVSGLHERMIKEIFADVYAVAHLIERDRYDPELVLNEVLAFRQKGIARRWGFRYLTHPFVLLAYMHREKIRDYDTLADFSQAVLLAKPHIWASETVVNFVALNLYDLGHVSRSDVLNKDRVKEAYRITNHYLGKDYRLAGGDDL